MIQRQEKSWKKIIGDILSDKLTGYDLKILSGAVPHLYRIRKGKYRVVFTKIAGNIDIIAVDTRGDIYKSL